MANRSHQVALCVELSAEAGAPPRVELIPAGPVVKGRDKREWLFDAQAQADVLAAFAARGIPLPIDREHATQHRAPVGQEAPAAAWIESLNVENGALWGTASWTTRGGEQVTSREYRFLSPVFDFDPSTGRIARLVSAGLTNTPNLHLQALNSEEPSMSLPAAITLALGIPADAADSAAVEAINKLKKERETAQAKNAEQPSLERYVPRADYDALKTRAENAETTLQAREKVEHKAAVDSEISAALKAGKITPATEEFYRATCAEKDGLDRFRKFVGTAPEIAGDAGLDGKKPAGTALNAEQIADKARAYQAEQAKAGNTVSSSAAVRHVMGEKA